ncbi:glycosyltransferase [Nostoc sp. FACHB-152]|nr:glycosyltransferase [Nostoc sp. FACHB-152]MBD2467028.1 glycosyltransferase [Nostoc sp. FACHB-145]
MLEQTMTVVERALLPARDYASPGLKIIQPNQFFPNMIVGNTSICKWPYLRHDIPHNWYVDQRQPSIGFLSRDEAHILYNTALKFKGKKALEIGCWLGWSACHMALAGVELDVVDPLLGREDIYESVSASLRAAGVFDSVNLVSGYSPQKVDELAQQLQRKWSLIFIDGDHEAPGPLNDAITCEKLAEPDALILFHDLNSPDVAQGLDYFKDKGWNTMIYQTMQIMGVAWRGNVEPVEHQPDPKINWKLPKHLKNYDVSHRSQAQLQIVGIEKLDNIKQAFGKIIIDGVFFQLYQTGIARVWRSLLEEWANSDFANHILVLDRANTTPKIKGIRYRTISAYDYNNSEADKQMLQQICDQVGAELFISSYYTTPMTTPSVFMAYDMIPEVMGWNMDNPMWQVKHQGIQQASSHIAISEHTARDLARFFPEVAVESITVAHCGVSSTFSPAKAEEVNAFKAKYGITKPYFILVGAGNGYKNSMLFFQAFAQLASSYGFDIVCTGSGGILAPEFRACTLGSSVYMLQLSDEELAIAYSGAVALVYPSKYEGFGMPIVEAMACGCPVITCANASIPEVGGEAVIYVKDDDVYGLANALCDVQKPSVRQALIKAGLAQAQKFSWSKMANIVSSALINATLLSLNLQEVNLIVFPDWLQSEELVGLELQSVIQAIATYPDSQKTTLLINTHNIATEDAQMLLSGIAMNLLMEEDLDISEGLEISLVGSLADVQWQALLPRLNSRIILEHEDKTALAELPVKLLPACKLESFVNQLCVL